jgi:hypothetical protein
MSDFNVGNTGICTKADGNYDTAYGATDAGSTSNNTALAVNNTGTGSYSITRGFLYFDTSAISDSVTVTSATLKLYASAKGGSGEIKIGASTSTNTTYANADYDLFGTETGGLDLTSINTSAYNSFTISSPNTRINKTGNTQLSVYTNYAFGSNFNATFNGSDAGSNKPVLEVILSSASPSASASASPSESPSPSPATFSFFPFLMEV